MAAKANESNREEDIANKRIEALITSQRYFDIMCKIVENEVNKAVSTTSLLPDQKSYFEKRFNEIFQAAISGNITLGFSTQSKESSSSNTVIKQDKRRYLNEILLPKWERTLVKTTFKRKYYPKECARLLHLRLKKEKKQLLVKEAVQNGALFSSLPSESFPESIKDTIRTTAKNLNSFTMNVQSKIDKVDRLLRSKQILNKIKNCKTDALVFKERRTSNSQTLSSVMRGKQLIVRGFEPLFQQ